MTASLQLALFAPSAPEVAAEPAPAPASETSRDPEMLRLARRYARERGWVLFGIVDRPGLIGPVPMAVLVDRAGAEQARTVEDLRAVLS